eukprot:3059409-Pleurochrysis_carterae.AAC.1
MVSTEHTQCRGGCGHSCVRNFGASKRSSDASKTVMHGAGLLDERPLHELCQALFLALADGGNQGRGVCLG